MTRVFLTGGSGFLGARLLAALRAAGAPVQALSRRPPPDAPGVTWVRGDLLDTDAYVAALTKADVVLHAAAATGRMPAAEHFRVNAVGTRALLAAAERARVPRFVLVSSIAVTFEDVRHYPYARAKREAETAVRGSGCAWTIVRPTMLTGPDAPVLAGLRRLAALPLIPVFGAGRARVQPAWVDDVAGLLADVALRPDAGGEVVEAGGPEVVTIEALLLAMHALLRGGHAARTVHLPLGPLAAVLAAVERVADGRLPLTAGQLCTFREDGVAQPHRRAAARGWLPLAEQLRRSLAPAR